MGRGYSVVMANDFWAEALDRIPETAYATRELVTTLSGYGDKDWADPAKIVFPILTAMVQIEMKIDEHIAEH